VPEFRLPYELAQFTDETPEELNGWLKRLWPILRSITGNGVRRTHDLLSELLPLERIEIPSGTKCFDWVVPKEWNVDAAYVLTPAGQRILDIEINNLHLVNYSIPFRGKVSREELDAHLFSLPEKPDAIPYVTSYYSPRWGFCIAHSMREKLEDGEYEVVIDSRFSDGSMTMSEAVLRGESSREVLISTYTCHPSMANNELSGPLLAAFLYRRLARVKNRRLTYRFIFLPETIGSIAYLQKNAKALQDNVIAGYVATCVGDSAPFTYKRSRRGNTLADRAAEHVLVNYAREQPRFQNFSPRGSDERQYCSPGFDLPVGVIARSIFHLYPEYHTSLDNLDFICAESLLASIDAYFAVCMLLDRNITYRRTHPFCEPHLGKYDLYPNIGAGKKSDSINELLWLLNLADGQHDLLAMSERTGLGFWKFDTAAKICEEKGLVTQSSQ